MKKITYLFVIVFVFFSTVLLAQEGKQSTKDTTIEGLTIYPNPTSGDKIYISSKSSLDKQIIIFDVLGKKVLQAEINGKELNIAALLPGVYIIKIKEEDATVTRKLIVK